MFQGNYMIARMLSISGVLCSQSLWLGWGVKIPRSFLEVPPDESLVDGLSDKCRTGSPHVDMALRNCWVLGMPLRIWTWGNVCMQAALTQLPLASCCRKERKYEWIRFSFREKRKGRGKYSQFMALSCCLATKTLLAPLDLLSLFL